MIVVIDGPAGAGKSTVARAAARRLGAAYLDTGAMYRALAWLAVRCGISPDASGQLAELAARASIRIDADRGGDRVLVDDHDVTQSIRRPDISAVVSQVSAHGEVRSALVEAQRALVAAGGDWVADGRDLGTVVWPDADVKVFLTASDTERARRRCDELRSRGEECTVEEVLADLRRRDELESTRAVAPLRPADDARLIDTTELSAEQVVARIVALADGAGA